MPPFRNLLRAREGKGAHQVSYLELFFDLVFVFAVTQVAHLMIAHPSPEGLLETIVIGLSVWWAWVYTTWAANWLDPESGPVKALFVTLMLLGMVMSSSIPGAFGDKGLVFAAVMVAFNVGRSIFTTFAFRREVPGTEINFIRITIWNAIPGLFWILGALTPVDTRTWIWIAALTLDYIAPAIRFWVPRLGGSSVTTWNISGEHMSERVSLFMIIALGESIIITGTQFSAQEFSITSLSAFLSALASTILMFFLYFNHAESLASNYLSAQSEESRGSVARTAYTYIPAILILGIILTAVADEYVSAHPLGTGNTTTELFGTPESWTAGTICLASALYLTGNFLFKRAAGGPWLWPHLGGIVALIVIYVNHSEISPLATNWATNLVLLLVVITDEMSYRKMTQAKHATTQN